MPPVSAGVGGPRGQAKAFFIQFPVFAVPSAQCLESQALACAWDLDVPGGRYWDVYYGTLAKAVRLSGEEEDLESWGMSAAVFPALRLWLGVAGGAVGVV